jgi:hypothetical protein
MAQYWVPLLLHDPTDPPDDPGLVAALRDLANVVLPASDECTEEWSARDCGIFNPHDDDDGDELDWITFNRC